MAMPETHDTRLEKESHSDCAEASLLLRRIAAHASRVTSDHFPSTLNAISSRPALPQAPYPDATKTIPFAMMGPVASIDPPSALIPFTVSRAGAVSKSQMIAPSLVE
jgi:hypothetical protein